MQRQEEQMQEAPQHPQQGNEQSLKLPNKKLHPRRSPQKALEITHTKTKSPYMCTAFLTPLSVKPIEVPITDVFIM